MDETNTQKIVSSALSLAIAGEWRRSNLAKVAKEAGLPLSEMFALVRSKTDIIRLVDDHLATQTFDDVGEIDEDASTRDTLFDLLMTRFELMNAKRSAYLGLYDFDAKDISQYPSLLGSSFGQIRCSMKLIAEASGVDTSGLLGQGRLSTLTYLYAKVWHVWMKDETEDLAATMKELDTRLSKAEDWALELKNFDLGKMFSSKN